MALKDVSLSEIRHRMSADTKEMKMSPAMLHFRWRWEGNERENKEQLADTEETAGQSDVLQAK